MPARPFRCQCPRVKSIKVQTEVSRRAGRFRPRPVGDCTTFSRRLDPKREGIHVWTFGKGQKKPPKREVYSCRVMQIRSSRQCPLGLPPRIAALRMQCSVSSWMLRGLGCFCRSGSLKLDLGFKNLALLLQTSTGTLLARRTHEVKNGLPI